jgi:hypothetical protein
VWVSVTEFKAAAFEGFTEQRFGFFEITLLFVQKARSFLDFSVAAYFS